MNNYQTDVIEFQARFGGNIGDRKRPKVINGPFRAAFILEECGEFLAAFQKGDLVEMADGLCDLLYVTIGTAVECGIDLYQHVPAFPDNVAPCPGSGLFDNRENLIARFVAAEASCAAAIASLHVGRVAFALAGMVENIKAAVEAWGINLRPLWAEVHRTNMAKVPSGSPDVKTIKPPGWKRPDLAPILAAQYNGEEFIDLRTGDIEAEAPAAPGDIETGDPI